MKKKRYCIKCGDYVASMDREDWKRYRQLCDGCWGIISKYGGDDMTKEERRARIFEIIEGDSFKTIADIELTEFNLGITPASTKPITITLPFALWDFVRGALEMYADDMGEIPDVELSPEHIEHGTVHLDDVRHGRISQEDALDMIEDEENIDMKQLQNAFRDIKNEINYQMRDQIVGEESGEEEAG